MTKVETGIIVYATLSTGFADVGLSPIAIDPHCPHFIRTLLAQAADWYHGSTKIRPLQKLEGRDTGEWLASEIQVVDRTLPIAVVSEIDGEVPLPNLSHELARDLAGVANVYQIDFAASWGLTEALGKSYSCYQGALRLYWPRFNLSDSIYAHQLWTVTRLLSHGASTTDSANRIRRQLRRMVMRASVVSVPRPSIIDSIRGASARR